MSLNGVRQSEHKAPVALLGGTRVGGHADGYESACKLVYEVSESHLTPRIRVSRKPRSLLNRPPQIETKKISESRS